MNHNTVMGHRMVTDMLLLGDAGAESVRAELRYSRRDPLAVEMRLSIDREPAVGWVFGRDLLIEGLRRPSGVGDVRLYPVNESVIIELRSTSGRAVLLSYLPDLADFVKHIVSVVPVGGEIAHDDIERELLELGQP
ncbi:MAG TPA: SsgA family sporulation/cell division regulator [Nakamurella sp.]|nr:SsgA family sporulation/cell division regulator [Nakamurella sp.]